MCTVKIILRMAWRYSVDLLDDFRRDILNNLDLKRSIDLELCSLLDALLSSDTFADTNRNMLAAKKREEIFTSDGGSKWSMWKFILEIINKE